MKWHSSAGSSCTQVVPGSADVLVGILRVIRADGDVGVPRGVVFGRGIRSVHDFPRAMATVIRAYFEAVLLKTEQALATARSPKPHCHFKRRTFRIFFMRELPWRHMPLLSVTTTGKRHAVAKDSTTLHPTKTPPQNPACKRPILIRLHNFNR